MDWDKKPGFEEAKRVLSSEKLINPYDKCGVGEAKG